MSTYFNLPDPKSYTVIVTPKMLERLLWQNKCSVGIIMESDSSFVLPEDNSQHFKLPLKVEKPEIDRIDDVWYSANVTRESMTRISGELEISARALKELRKKNSIRAAKDLSKHLTDVLRSNLELADVRYCEESSRTIGMAMSMMVDVIDILLPNKDGLSLDFSKHTNKYDIAALKLGLLKEHCSGANSPLAKTWLSRIAVFDDLRENALALAKKQREDDLPKLIADATGRSEKRNR